MALALLPQSAAIGAGSSSHLLPPSIGFVSFLLLSSACAALHPSFQEPLVDIRELSPAIRVDIPYATPRNFTGQTLYPVNRCLLRRSVAKRLALVQSDLARHTMGLKIWDCYRPLSIQRKLWELKPDPDYVADPKRGSRHNRGAAVDVTLLDAAGLELEMPTGYDDFSERAHRSYTQASPSALSHRRILEDAMLRRGFTGLKTEWWHFDANGWEKFDLMDEPLPPASPAP